MRSAKGVCGDPIGRPYWGTPMYWHTGCDLTDIQSHIAVFAYLNFAKL